MRFSIPTGHPFTSYHHIPKQNPEYSRLTFTSQSPYHLAFNLHLYHLLSPVESGTFLFHTDSPVESGAFYPTYSSSGVLYIPVLLLFPSGVARQRTFFLPCSQQGLDASHLSSWPVRPIYLACALSINSVSPLIWRLGYFLSVPQQSLSWPRPKHLVCFLIYLFKSTSLGTILYSLSYQMTVTHKIHTRWNPSGLSPAEFISQGFTVSLARMCKFSGSWYLITFHLECSKGESQSHLQV